jgi:polyketide synthase-associated protein
MAEEEGEEVVAGLGGPTEAYAPGLQPLEFKLVAISKDQAPLDPTPEALQEDPTAQAIKVAEKKGQTLAWVVEEGKYLVETFDGDIVGIAPGQLSEFEPLPPETSSGGFDTAFPSSPFRQEIFAGEILEVLSRKQYCVVQMSSNPDDRMDAMLTCGEILESKPNMWLRFEPDFERQYLGRDCQLKKALWTDVQRTEVPNGLDKANELLTNVGLAVMPLCSTLGFLGFTKTNGMVHTLATQEEEDYLLRLVNGEGKVVDAKTIQDHLAFCSRAKLCMMYIMKGGGGQVTFHPRNGEGEEPKLTTLENQVIIWRHDLLDYTYIPKDGEYAMQSWILREQHGSESEIEARPEEANFEALAKVPSGPTHKDTDNTVDVISMGLRIPGTVWNLHDYWSLLSMGTDAIVMVPVSRWDLDIYWSAEPNTPGRGYVRHFGFLDQEQMASFDCGFFGIEEEEAMKIDPPARVCCEVGYDALYRGGWTREKLKGVGMAYTFGYYDSEFAQMVNRNTFGPPDATRRLNTSCWACSTRLQYTFGMTGPATCVETACSSSLTGVALTHTYLRPQLQTTTMAASCRKHYDYGLSFGSNGHFDPFYTIALCGAGMLTHGGRCFTFDQSADGFVRGEGTACMHLRCAKSEDLSRLAILAGSAMNQDGRSASLTAPHGPSQQECIRLSLREAAILALDIQIQELHGTGTALGDPIEVGALRATMMTYQGVVRDHPLVKTSSKSNLGHTEMCAGINGIMKCVIMAVYAASAPNIHMRLLNPHIDSAAYPVYFSNEFVEQGSPVGFFGVSSFGFGGSNARGDIWGRCQAGPRNTQPGLPRIDFSDARLYSCYKLFNAPCIPKPGTAPPQAAEDPDALDGDYVTGNPMSPQNSYFIEGSFNAWKDMEQMYYLADKDAWAYALAIGDTCCEQFKIICNKFDDAKVFPVSKMASSDDRVLGPGTAPEINNWLIDARKDGYPAGTAYMIYFSWNEQEKKRKVWWEKCADERGFQMVASQPKFVHRYLILGSWNGFAPARLDPVPGEPGFYQTTVRIGLTGHEEFHFVRDGDTRQIIYPATKKALRPTVPVRGPDIYGEGKYWSLVGTTGDLFTVQFQVLEGQITVTTSSPAYGTRTFRSSAEKSFYVTRQNYNWGYEQMNTKDGSIYTLQITLSSDGFEAFQIAEDMNSCLAIYPEMPMAGNMMSQVCGPDAKGDGLHWALVGAPGSTVEITLDFNQTDKAAMVTWETVSQAALEG